MTQTNPFEAIRKSIQNHPSNREFTDKGWEPLFSAGHRAKIVIIGQAPGLAAQQSHIPWNDISGDTLRGWLGISKEQFHDTSIISLLPMDFYYPGKNPLGGDLPPRKDFADMWHKKIIENMPNVKLTILVGTYAQKYYLGKNALKNLTENVQFYEKFLPQYFPIVHPSPLAGRWRAKNPWFEKETLPELRKIVAEHL